MFDRHALEFKLAMGFLNHQVSYCIQFELYKHLNTISCVMQQSGFMPKAANIFQNYIIIFISNGLEKGKLKKNNFDSQTGSLLHRVCSNIKLYLDQNTNQILKTVCDRRKNDVALLIC